MAGFLLLLTCLSGCGHNGETLTQECFEHPSISLRCGWAGVQDVVMLPGGDRFLLSQSGDNASGVTSGIIEFKPVQDVRRRLQTSTSLRASGSEQRWGDARCNGAPPERSFRPGRMHVAYRADGRLQLLVVNQGARRAIEYFEVVEAAPAQLIWRGCVHTPDDRAMGDVFGLEDGGFLLSTPYPLMGRISSLLRGYLLRRDTGYVLLWRPQAGYLKVPHSDSAGPMGLAASDDGREIFVLASFTGELLYLDRLIQDAHERVRVGFGTDLNRFADRLLTVVREGSAWEQLRCEWQHDASCDMPFVVVDVSAGSLAAIDLYRESVPVGLQTPQVALATESEVVLLSRATARSTSQANGWFGWTTDPTIAEPLADAER